MRITNVSVTVMRSFDYCHFEVSLSAQVEGDTIFNGHTIDHADTLRKSAARLADKAVEQYKIKKRALELIESYDFKSARRIATEAEKTPEADRTPEQKAAIKRLADMRFEARFDYEDDWHAQDDEEDDE